MALFSTVVTAGSLVAFGLAAVPSSDTGRWLAVGFTLFVVSTVGLALA